LNWQALTAGQRFGNSRFVFGPFCLGKAEIEREVWCKNRAAWELELKLAV
jgi:hypothetical protein